MRVALDTNRYVDLCKGLTGTVALPEEAEAILLPFVVLGELRAGFAHGRRTAENERVLRFGRSKRRRMKDEVAARGLRLVDELRQDVATDVIPLGWAGSP